VGRDVSHTDYSMVNVKVWSQWVSRMMRRFVGWLIDKEITLFLTVGLCDAKNQL